MSASPYDEPIQTLPGVGPAKQRALEALGISKIKDLLSILPKGYQNRVQLPIRDLKSGMQARVVGTILRLQTLGSFKHQRLEMILKDGTGFLKLVFFQLKPVAYLLKAKPGTQLTVTGEVTAFNAMMQMVHPKVALGNKPEPFHGVCAIYPELKGLSSHDLTKFIEAALEQVQKASAPDWPIEKLQELKLLPLLESYQTIHQPVEAIADPGQHPAFRRMAFEELYHFQCRLLKHRQIQLKLQSPILPRESARELFQGLLPFAPTHAQIRVIQEISDDTSQSYPMLRLLQGDVGSGKTAVAACAAKLFQKNGYQTAMMAPTEILAEQHFHVFSQLFGSERVGKLMGSLSVPARREMLKSLQSGNIDILIGTHALISEDVVFKNLGLCIVDEQHRFGVHQRSELRNKGRKGSFVPHVLAMTATPIPRSLALTAYGDFALSVLDELPPGRTPVSTHLLQGDPQKNVLMLADKCLRNQEQAYIIYPLVEESEKMDLLNAEQAFAELAGRFGSDRVALIHGRMTGAEKESAMHRFASAQADLLVSTTVIEVGVNVPNATCMMIVHPERFGLSQLHQLRGRVGRGERKSTCFLLTPQLFPSEETYRRLAILEKSQDGFEIAAEDLKIRGPGDFLGTRQSGLPIFHHCDLVQHADLIEPARQLAQSIISFHP